MMILLPNGTPLMIGGGQLKPRMPPTPVDVFIVGHGDSITNYDGDGSGNYLQVIASSIRSGQGLEPKVFRRGLTGNSFNYDWGHANGLGLTLIEDGPYIDSLQRPGITNWLIVFAGTNGIALKHNSAAQEYADFETYILARIAAGWVAENIVVGTMLPRPPHNTARATFNSSLKAGAATYGYRIAAFDEDPRIGDDDDNLDGTYYADDVHLNVAGQQIIGQIAYDAMYPA